MKRAKRTITFAVLAGLLPLACGDDDEGGPVNTGRSCDGPSECYLGIEAGALRGEVECLSRVPGGYCTHECDTDADCCAVPGECPEQLPVVCAPFESAGQKYCFLSCEDAVLEQANESDANRFCTTYANPAFNCRSTGGGSENRKVCVQ